jgi:membrane-associated protease RseP (regulator of RpoE activity)
MSAYFSGFILLSIPAVLFVHEIGHLIAARWYGVRVLRLSIGLGPEVLGFTDRMGTRWTLAILPFGGSLEMNDDRNSTTVTAAQVLSNKSLNQRAAIYAAGPLLNLLFAGGIYGCSLAIFGEGALLATVSEKPAVVLMSLLSGFSVFVALFSLIPIPPLDGGWLALFGIEALTRKPISEHIQKKLCTGGMAIIVFATMISILAFASHVVAANSGS